MKKSTLLSLATAGAIVATSAFTFATWDKTTAEQTLTVSYANPVTVSMDALSFPGDKKLGDTINGVESVDVDVPVEITGSKNGDKLKLSATGPENATLQGVSVSFKKGDTILTDGEDTITADGKTTYKAVVSIVKDGNATEKPADASLTSNISIKAELSRVS